MNNLIYKEIKLAIPVFFWILPILTGALIMIPQWVFIVAFLYFFWITVPQIFATNNTQNDMAFSLLMPINRNEYVKSKIMTMVLLGLAHILFGAIFASLNVVIYDSPNFLLDLNFTLFGVVFFIYGLFNLIFFSLYFRTGYNFGLPTIVANIVIFLIAAGVETLNILYPKVSNILEGTSSSSRLMQLGFLVIGILSYMVFNYIAYKISIRKFERVDL